MKYLSAWVYLVAIAIILLTVMILGIYWVVYSPNFFLKALGAVYVVMTIFLLSDRDVFLPFLGETVFPKALLRPQEPTETSKTVRVEMKGVVDGTPVVYWAAEPSESHVKDPWTAYSNYENAGVSLVQMETVEFKVRPPASYFVPSGRLLKQHVHYRILQANGMLSNVKTAYIS